MIYLSVTTIPSRIKHFKRFYQNIYSGSLKPDKIILNIYSISLRGIELKIPKSIIKLENLIIIKNNIDHGPILKFLAIFENFISPDDFFIYCDDDIVYHHDWLKYLIENIKINNNISGYAINSGVCLLCRLRYLKFNGTNHFIRGYGGVGLQKKYLNFSKNDVLNSLKNYNMKMSDDLIISYHVNKNNLSTIPVKYSLESIPFDYSKNLNSISKGANNTLLPNKTRYYNICKNNKEIGKCFTLDSYLFKLNKFDKKFKNEFTKFKDKLLNNKYFSLVRFNDGEINYIYRRKFNASDHQCNNNEIPIEFCNMLKESLCYNKDNYYVGIPCGCCEYRDKFRMNIKNNFKVNNNNLTFANIFINSNYFHFKKNIIPILKRYPIILISNKNTKLSKFINKGYNVKKWFSVDYNAWKNYQEIIDQVLNYSKNNNIISHLYIVCAGPVSNVLIYNLYKQENRNIYLDLGSVMDYELGLGTGTRNYNQIFGWKSLSTCYWEKPSNWYQISCDSQSKSKLMRFILKMLALIYNLIFLIKNCFSNLKRNKRKGIDNFVYITKKPFNEGSTRLIYKYKNNKCIKIEKKIRIPFYKTLFFQDGNWNKREFDWLNYYKNTNLHSYFPKCYGYIETNKGKGLIYDLILDDNDNISKNLTEYLKDNSMSNDILKEINDFKKMCINENIYLSDITPNNFLIQRKKNKLKLYYIDGVPDSLRFMIFGKLLKCLNKYKIINKFKRLFHFIKKIVSKRN